MEPVKPFQMIGKLIMRTVVIAAVLIFFFSMMAGMYYKSEPRGVRTAICDEDFSPLSRSIIYSIKASDFYKVVEQPADYHMLQKLVDEGKVDLGVVIPHDAYRDVLNRRSVRVLAVLNGTANPIVPKLSLAGLNRIVMTLNNQYAMHIPVEDLGTIPNVRHPKTPLLMVSERVFYSPTMNMEASMLPAFMGLAMQIVSMLIVLLALRTNHRYIVTLIPKIRFVRQMPLKAILLPVLTSWLMVGTAISLAFFATMQIFQVPLPPNGWNTVAVIFMLVLAMESISLFFTLNINNVIPLIVLITLIVLPAFMYSGFLVPLEQMAHLPKVIGGLFPLRHYLTALYGVFNHHLPLHKVIVPLFTLVKFIAIFLTLSAVSVVIGAFERRRIHFAQIENERKTQLNTEVN